LVGTVEVFHDFPQSDSGIIPYISLQLLALTIFSVNYTPSCSYATIHRLLVTASLNVLQMYK